LRIYPCICIHMYTCTYIYLCSDIYWYKMVITHMFLYIHQFSFKSVLNYMKFYLYCMLPAILKYEFVHIYVHMNVWNGHNIHIYMYMNRWLLHMLLFLLFGWLFYFTYALLAVIYVSHVEHGFFNTPRL
jgi:hypothetical protein